MQLQKEFSRNSEKDSISKIRIKLIKYAFNSFGLDFEFIIYFRSLTMKNLGLPFIFPCITNLNPCL